MACASNDNLHVHVGKVYVRYIHSMTTPVLHSEPQTTTPYNPKNAKLGLYLRSCMTSIHSPVLQFHDILDTRLVISASAAFESAFITPAQYHGEKCQASCSVGQSFCVLTAPNASWRRILGW